MLRNVPILTEELSIDQFRPDDVDDLFVLMNHAAIKEFIPDRYRTKEELQQKLEFLISNYSMKKDDIIRITLGIRLRKENRLIGWISYGPLPYDESLKEIAYAIDPAYWNKGYATAVGKAFLQWLCNNITDGDIYAQVNPTNHRSIRVLEKLGMVKIKEVIRKRESSARDIWIYKLQRKKKNTS